MSSLVEFERLLRARMGAETPSEEIISRLHRHYEVLVKWNRVMSLTTVETLEQAVERHYCESLYLGARVPDSVKSLADVGSGAGFPGFPAAAIRPDVRTWLIESNRKKASFLREACGDLKNVRVFAGRAEEFNDSVDCVISRAVKLGDVVQCAARLGSGLMLLVGEADAAALRQDARWRWNESALPWGERRRLLIGHCST